MQDNNWTRSPCPICRESFSHKKDYTPVTCGRHLCIQEANKRGLYAIKLAEVREAHPLCTFEELGQLTDAALKAGEALEKALHEDSRIADNMRDYWKNRACGEES